MAVQIKGNGTDQTFLFGVIDRTCWVNKTARPPIPDLKEHEGLAILADDVDFAAAIVDIALQNPDARLARYRAATPSKWLPVVLVPSMAAGLLL